MVTRADGNLLHDTIYRRTRRAIVETVHAADAVLGRVRGNTLRILFEAASPVSVAVSRPVLRRLAADPRLEFWYTTNDESWNGASIFADAALRNRTLTAAQVRWMKFDGYLNTDFWNMTWLPRRTRRIHLFHGVAGKYDLDQPTRIAPVIATFDRLMFPNRDRLDRYAAAGLVDPDSPRAALIGYPKVDCLVDGSLDRSAIERGLGVVAGRPTVLYAPTWSPFSSLSLMGREVIEALARLDVNVVVKLHDRSYDATARASGGVNWRSALDDLRRTHDIRIATDSDSSPYLYAADVLVTDHSSVGFEYTLLDRPIVVIDSPKLVELAAINPQKVALLQSASLVVRRASEIAGAVRDSLRDPAALSHMRRSIAADLFYRAGTATARAVECFYDALALSSDLQLDRNVLRGGPCQPSAS